MSQIVLAATHHSRASRLEANRHSADAEARNRLISRNVIGCAAVVATSFSFHVPKLAEAYPSACSLEIHEVAEGDLTSFSWLSGEFRAVKTTAATLKS